MPIKTLMSFMIFSAEVLNPRQKVGAAWPSGPTLTRRMASFLPTNPSGYVVELGAGTGAITDSLLKHGINPKRLFAVEMSEKMSGHLRKRFPKINVLTGDAAHLRELLPRKVNPGHISYIVSSLPFKVMDDGLVRRIANEVRETLPEHGRLIQYTYDIRPRRNRWMDGILERVDGSLVWTHIPPAVVDVFRPIKSA